MAKKKSSSAQVVKPLHKPEDPVRADQVAPAMDGEASATIESLKSLNMRLLKEVQSMRSLEPELSRANVEKDALKSELIELGETAARLELERSMVAVFVAAQVGVKGEDVARKMKELEVEMMALKVGIDEKESVVRGLSEKLSEIEGELGYERNVLRGISVERDELKNELHLQVEECERLKSNFSKLEKGKKEIERQLGQLQVGYDDVVSEKGELEMRIEFATKEKDMIGRSLEEVIKCREELEEQLGRVVREKGVIAKEKNVEMSRRKGLENDVDGLKEKVVGLQNEEEKLRANLAKLEKQLGESEETQREIRREIDQVVEEKKMREKRIEGLVAEKAGFEKDLKDIIKQLDVQKLKREELVNEKVVVLEAKGRLDGEVAVLQNQVAELKDVVLKLEECNRVEVEKNKSLDSEVGEYREKLRVVKAERDELGNFVDKEKENAELLKGIIRELENKIEGNLKATGQAKAENAEVFAAKVALESECAALKKKITSLESALTEAQHEFESVKCKVEWADANSELVLNILKDTASFCSKDEDDAEGGDLVDKFVNGEEAKPYVTELDLIRNAFKNNSTKVENMRRQVEFLQNSVDEAHKKKGFWTMLSSATSILAAVSLAYIVRGH